MAKFDPPVLQTQRLKLRPFRFDDADRAVRFMNDFEVTKTLARAPHPYTLEDANGWISRIIEADGLDRADLVIDLGEGLAGCVGLRVVDETIELGYWLARLHWGNGLMSEAVSAVLTWLFEASDADIVQSGVFETNPASLRIQDKLGFEVVGRSMVHCLAQGADLPHIDTRLQRNQFRPLAK